MIAHYCLLEFNTKPNTLVKSILRHYNAVEVVIRGLTDVVSPTVALTMARGADCTN